MNSPQPISDLLNKKMDRRDFLKHVGIGLIGVAGLGTVIKIAGYKMAEPQQMVNTSSKGVAGYGDTVYGR